METQTIIILSIVGVLVVAGGITAAVLLTKKSPQKKGYICNANAVCEEKTC